MLKKINNQKGVTQVIVVFIMTALLAASALVIDIGSAMAKRIAFSNAIDAATLAGVMELPSDPVNATAIANQYIVTNGFQITDITITIADDDHSITIAGNLPHNFYLAPIMGINSTTLGASAKAIIGPIGKTNGLRPFGIDNQSLVFGQQVTLKDGGGDGENGNFGGVAFLDLFGANEFNQNILYGFDGTVGIGDVIDTEPGNMASSINVINQVINSDPYSTYDNYEADSPRVWKIPVLDNMDVNGRSAVTVVGFAAFFVEVAGSNAGNAEVTGRFIEFTTSGEIDNAAPTIGVYAMKLVE